MKTTDSSSSLNNGNVDTMDNFRFRTLLLNLQDRLSERDRKRLHFYFANVVPKRIQDDSSLSGTLALLETLFQQDRINEHDLTTLIKALDVIQCYDASKLVQDYMRRLQSNEISQSVISIVDIIPSWTDKILEDVETDSVYIHRTGSRFGIYKNTRHREVPGSVNNLSKYFSPLKRKALFHFSLIEQQCCLFFVFLSIVFLGVAIGFGFWIMHLQMKYTICTKDVNNINTTMKEFKTMMKTRREDVLNRLHNLENKCALKFDFRPEITTSPPLEDLYPNINEDLACLKACHQCVDKNLSANQSDRSTNKCGPLCDCANACATIQIQEINKWYSQQNYTSDKKCFKKTYDEALKDKD